MSWIPMDDTAPVDREIMLWLSAPEGSNKPIGQVVGLYVENDFFSGWAEKSVSGNINNGLPQNLITHWMDLEDDPE